MKGNRHKAESLRRESEVALGFTPNENFSVDGVGLARAMVGHQGGPVFHKLVSNLS